MEEVQYKCQECFMVYASNEAVEHARQTGHEIKKIYDTKRKLETDQ